MSNIESLKINIIKGKGIPIRGNDIDTDRITPARFLKEITFEKMGDYLFYDERFTEKKEEKEHPLNEDKFNKGSILFVGDNFGCGSSREHAAQAVKRYGITAIVGESFSEIFSGNCKNLGIPTVKASPEVISHLQTISNKYPDTPFLLNLEKEYINDGERDYKISIPADWKQAFLNGTWNAIEVLKSNIQDIQAKDKALKY